LKKEDIEMWNSATKIGGSLVMDRRKFLAIAGGLVAAGVLPKEALALAAPYSFKQGTYDVTVVSDGTLMLPIAMIFPDAPVEDLKTLLGAVVDGDKAQFQVNVLLLKSGTDTILIDTGTGGGFQPSAGTLMESIKAAGSDPSAVTKVIYTHAHGDHIAGTAGKDGLNFQNATYHMAETEWNFWSPPDLASKMPKEMEGMILGIQSQMTAIKDKVSFFKPGAEIVSGLAAIDTAGHTPGHVSFELAGGDGMIITGDAITNAAVFFPHPDWKFSFDADHATASANRKKLLDMAASAKKKLLGYHWPYPGIGMAEAKDGAWTFVPQA
jgi:glyoxylase-like metal-dependent hydrolase (beta-lactamase superfamily II)